jgi:hypothetical protein
VQAAGPSFVPAFSFANGLGNGRTFTAGGARRFLWDDGCSCFQYANATTVRLVP